MGIMDKLPTIAKVLKFAFPKPQIPQKRYLVIAGMILYWAAKAYVVSTPSPHDDHYPDKVRDAAVLIFAAEDEKPDPSSDYDEDGLRYGERS